MAAAEAQPQTLQHEEWMVEYAGDGRAHADAQADAHAQLPQAVAAWSGAATCCACKKQHMGVHTHEHHQCDMNAVKSTHAECVVQVRGCSDAAHSAALQ